MGKKEIISRIEELKKKRNAVILVHNYQLPEVQDIADFLGDSLELSIKASKVDADVIVFCGVYFMAETAKILSPEKKVIIPDKNATCPMAMMIAEDDLRNLRKEYKDSVFVAYVNTRAWTKALVDICCTSANATKVVNSIEENRKIVFIPDKYLGDYAMRKTGRDMILWNGYCPTHVLITEKDIMDKKNKFKDAVVMCHPECTPPVIDISDEVLSTSGMVKFAKESKEKVFIVGTEVGLNHRLKKENPEKIFIPATERAICPNMKRITLEKVLWALEDLKYEVEISEDIRRKAFNSVKRMTEIV
ncbi:MAG: quinolinate synthase [Caldiserica bacterium]|nr:MAG: quinolinate synthase [Caldisericota bacterium]